MANFHQNQYNVLMSSGLGLIFFSVFFIFSNTLFAGELTAKDIIQKTDTNQLFVTQSFAATMTISKGKRQLIKKFHGHSQKDGEKSYIVFTNAEDRGVKYLKLAKELWIYFPDADEIMKISGHMLKQGMMGSDISYEDMLETEHLETNYTYKKLNDQKIDEYSCYVVELNAKVDKAIYEKQIIFIDKKTFVARQINMYARGDRLIKKMSQSNIKQSNKRFFAGQVIIQDMRKKDSSTKIIFERIDFNLPIPKRTFDKRTLKR